MYHEIKEKSYTLLKKIVSHIPLLPADNRGWCERVYGAWGAGAVVGLPWREAGRADRGRPAGGATCGQPARTTDGPRAATDEGLPRHRLSS